MERQLGQPETASKYLMAHDFLGSIIHRMALRSDGKFVFNIHDIKLHAAFKKTYNYLVDKAENIDIELEFTIQPDRVHGDSQTVSEELKWLSYFGMVQGYNGSYSRLIYDASHPSAQMYGQSAYLSSELADELTDVFTTAYQS